MNASTQPQGEAPARRRQMMVFRAFLAQNVSIGSAFGSFGVAVLPLQERYGASRGTTALALALCVLVMGLVSPYVGTLIGRIGLRRVMLAGTVISGLGYAALAFAPSMPVVLLLYALPLGLGLTMIGPFAASVLASNWYAHNPGPALGIANMPLFVAVFPLIAMGLIRDHGLATLYLSLAALHLLLLPVLLGVVDRPGAGSDAAGGHAPLGGHGAADQAGSAMQPSRTVLRSPAFWIMCLGAGFLNAAGITSVSHLVPFAVESGLPASQGAMLLSINGGAAVLGSLLVGVLCGRIGAARTLALIGSVLALSWLVLASTALFPAMAAATLLMGAGAAGVFPAVTVLSGLLFGQATLPRAIGLFGLMTLPLTFALPPLAGVLRDAAGSYGPVVSTVIAGCAAVAVIFYLLARAGARPAAAHPSAA